MKAFALYDEEFIVDDNFEKYNEYRQGFVYLAQTTLDEFDKMYNGKITNLDILINKIPELVKGLIMNVISICAIKILVQEGIMNINEEVFLEKYYYDYLDFDKYFDPILEKYVEITEASDNLNRYREMQKMSRSRWQGGGFGVKGAIKGAMVAGALNLGTDVLRSFGDSGNASRDAKKINSLKQSVYNDSKTLNLLRNGVYYCAFGVFYGVISELNENGILSEVYIDKKESQIIFDNTLKYEKKSANIIDNVIKCIKMNPYNIEFYKVLVNENKDNNDNIIEIASFFGFKEQIVKFVDDLIFKKNEAAKEIAYKEEQKREASNIYFSKDELKNCKYDIEKEIDFLRNGNKSPNVNDILYRGFELGNCYKNSERGFKKDLKRAFFWYDKAASAGSNLSQYYVAECYLNGEGIERDIEKGIELKIQLGKLDDHRSIVDLGKYYFNGKFVEKDYKKAYFWFDKVKDNIGAYYLGIIHQEGKGVEKNIDLAKEYFIKA